MKHMDDIDLDGMNSEKDSYENVHEDTGAEKDSSENAYEDLTKEMGKIFGDDFSKKHTFFSEAISWLEVIAAAILIAFVLNTFIIANSEVPSGSMENTIATGSRILGSRLTYKFSDPKYGDIVIFKWPDDESIYFVKRVIGTPGDTVTLVQDDATTKVGHVEVNGTALDEPYIKEPMVVSDDENGLTFEVPEDSYFCLGDNRNNSRDARYWTNTYVKKEKVVAKAEFVYFPKPKNLRFSSDTN